MATKVEYVVSCSNAGKHELAYGCANETTARHMGEVVAARGCYDEIVVHCIYHVSRTIVEPLAEYRKGQLVEQPPRVVPFLRGHFENWRHNRKLPLPDLRDLAEWLRQNADMLEHLQDRQRGVTQELCDIIEAICALMTERAKRGVT